MTLMRGNDDGEPRHHLLLVAPAPASSSTTLPLSFLCFLVLILLLVIPTGWASPSLPPPSSTSTFYDGVNVSSSSVYSPLFSTMHSTISPTLLQQEDDDLAFTSSTSDAISETSKESSNSSDDLISDTFNTSSEPSFETDAPFSPNQKRFVRTVDLVESSGSTNPWTIEPDSVLLSSTPLLVDPVIKYVCEQKSLCSRTRLLVQSNASLQFCDMFPILPVIYNIPSPVTQWQHHEPVDLNKGNSCRFDAQHPLFLPFTSPLDKYLNTQSDCVDTLSRLKELDNRAREVMIKFDSLLERFSCVAQVNDSFGSTNNGEPHPGMASCSSCRTAYKNWICSSTFDLFVRVDESLTRVPACQQWCTQVEKDCPYFSPSEDQWNGGEPSFLCDESHYHHSSRYRPPETTNCGLGDNIDICCYAGFHLHSMSYNKNRVCPTIERMCRQQSASDEGDYSLYQVTMDNSSALYNTGNWTSSGHHSTVLHTWWTTFVVVLLFLLATVSTNEL